MNSIILLYYYFQLKEFKMNFQTVINNYGLCKNCDIYDFQHDYPNIKIINGQRKYLLKCLFYDDKYLKNLNEIYKNIQTFRDVRLPILTKQNEYVDFENKVILFNYDKVSDLKPNNRWWGIVLSELHKIVYSTINIDLITINDISDDIMNILDAKTRIRLIHLLELQRNHKYVVDGVICHGDVANRNVLFFEELRDYLLIDFENSKIYPKEYDIQRLIWNLYIENDSFNFLNFWTEFTSCYDAQGNYINKELLSDLLIDDFVKNYLWLERVVNDETRNDRNRHKITQDKLGYLLNKGTISKLVKIIRGDFNERGINKTNHK